MEKSCTIRDFNAQKYHHTVNLDNPNHPWVMMLNHITDNATILDVGCACGDFGVVLKNLKNAEVYGLEYNEKSAQIALSTGAYKKVTPFDLDNIKENDFPQYTSKFDFIVCGDILEHLRDPKFVLNILKGWLKQGGFILASIPNVGHMHVKSNLLLNNFTYTSAGLLDETHIHFFTYKSIAIETSSVHLKIDDCDFTMVDKFAWTPSNPYPLLPYEILKFLFKDYHSYVCQYVVKMSVSSENQDSLLQNNLNKLDINELTAPFYILNYRNELLQELFLSDL